MIKIKMNDYNGNSDNCNYDGNCYHYYYYDNT